MFLRTFDKTMVQGRMIRLGYAPAVIDPAQSAKSALWTMCQKRKDWRVWSFNGTIYSTVREQTGKSIMH